MGILLFELERHKSGKERIARILRHSGKDGIIKLFVNVKIIGESFRQCAPLIVAEIVEHHPHHALSRFEFGKHGFAHHHRREQGRVFCIGMLHPRLIVAANKLGEGGIGFFFLRAQQFVHRRVGSFFKLQLPVHEFFVEFFPRFGILRIVHTQRNAREVLSITDFCVFLSNLLCVDVLFEREKNLHRIDGFQQIVCDLRSDGLIHQIFCLVFRHHHHGHLRMQGFDGGQGFESRESGHIFIEQHEVEGLCFAQIDGISTIIAGGDVVSSFFEKEAMGAKEVYFIIHPKKSCAHDGVHYVSTKLVQFMRLCKDFNSFDKGIFISIPSNDANDNVNNNAITACIKVIDTSGEIG